MNAQEMTAAVEQALSVLEPNYRGEAAESDLYEACLLAILVEAARDAGGRIFYTIDGRSPAPLLRFRCHPGRLWVGDYTYIVV